MPPEAQPSLTLPWRDTSSTGGHRTAVKLLKIYVNEGAYFDDRKVFEVVIARAHVAGLAGATLLQALAGFGSAPVRPYRTLFDHDQSLVIEILDEEPTLRSFVDSLSDLDQLGPVTLEAVELLRWNQVPLLSLKAAG